MSHTAEPRARAARLSTLARLRGLAATLITLLAAGGLTLVGAAPAAAAPPAVSVSVSGGEILAGETGTVTVTVSNPGALDGYNAAVYLDVPVGVAFVASSLGTPVIYDAANPPATALPAGMQRWVWEDISDLPAGGDVSGTVELRPAQPARVGGETADPAVFPVGSTVSIAANAALSSDPTLLPVFNGSTGVGGAAAVDATGTAGPETVELDVIPLLVTKAEPSPEAELLRGIHEHTTVYTLTVRTTDEGDTDSSTLVDYVPAGLEFLGCGTVDNSTVDRGTGDALVNEYDGAPSLTATPAVGADCLTPVSVGTIVADAALAASHGLAAGAVYTRVEWNLGTLAAGSTTTIRYAAGIPLRENTVTWDATQPSASSLAQGSNLDNNNGPSTRHGSSSPVDGDVWTNVATVDGDYAGVVRTATTRTATDSDSVSVHAMDLSILKSVAAADSQFAVGNVADFTLTLRGGEYMSSGEVVVTDTLPNGLCPLLPAGASFTLDSGVSAPADCGATGTVTGAEVVSATAHADGTFTLVMRPTDGGGADAFALAPSTEHTITYQALNRDAYVTAGEFGPTTSGDAFANAVEVTGTTTAIDPILGAYPATQRVWDDSSAEIGTDLTTISKTVMPRDQVQADLPAGTDPCTAGSFSDSRQSGFRMGDTVCFELTVDFPSSIDVRNPVVSDFLPAGLTYAGHATAAASTVDGAAVSVDTSGTTAGRLTWTLGSIGEGGHLYVPRGATFVVHVWATVDTPSNGVELDKPQNLMKYRQQNVQGELYFLRDQADIEVDREMQLVKGVLAVEDNAAVSSSTRPADSQDGPDGSVALSNRDGIEVREGETVTYRIDLTALPYDAIASEVWDVLPAGITAADVSAISHGGVAYDAGAPGRPTGLASTYAARTLIVWTGVPVPSGEQTLTYDVTIPTPTGVTRQLDNIASIISYRAGINTSTDPGAQEYIPAGSLDTSRAGSANTVGTGTVDDSSVHLPAASVAKSVTSDVARHNTSVQVVPGEVAHFTYSVTIPAHTSVYSGVLTDVIAGAANWQVVAAATTVDHPGGSTAPGDASFDLGGQTFTVTTATGTVTFPATYTNATDADQTFTVHLDAYVRAASGWTHSTTARNDTARFTSTGAPTLNSTATVRVIEPNPTLTKTANDDTVVAGQTITYTIVATNAANRPTLFDTVVTDCVPDALQGVTIVSATQGSASIVTDPTCGTGTAIEWTIGAIDGPPPAVAPATLTYTATVTPSAAGGAQYTNTALLTGYSLDDPATDRRTYTRTTPEVVTVVGAGIIKSVDAPTATVGQERSFSVAVTIPANVNFYDAAIIDDVPAGMALSGATVSCLDASSVNCDATLPGGGAALTPSGTLQGWWLGDVRSAPTVRTVTVTYTGTVLDAAGNANGTALTNTARLRWNTVDTLTDPPTASFTGTQTAGPATATVTVVEPAMTIAKTVEGAAAADVDPGETFTYAVTARSTGTSTAYGITVTDTVPAGVVVNAASISGGGVLTGATATGGGTITWAVATLAASTSRTFTYDAVLADSTTLTGAALTNTVAVTEFFSHPGGPGFDPDERRQYAGPSTTAQVTPQFPEPQIAKAATGTVAYIGRDHEFTLTLTNPGDSTAQDVTVTDVLPAGFVYTTGSAVVNPGATALEPSIAGDTLTWTGLPDLDPGDTVTVTYQAQADPAYGWDATTTGATVPHTNTATVTARDTSNSPGNITGPYTDQATATVRIHLADLGITKTHGSAPVAGETITWDIQVTNDGPDPAVGPIVVTEQLPADAVFESVAGAGWTAGTPDASNVVTLTHPGPLAAGASLDLAVTASFAEDIEAGTDATNRVCVDAGTFDASAANDCATDPGTVITLADVYLTKVATAATYVAGEDITWEIEVGNNGPSTSRAPLTVTDTLPAAVDWTTVSVDATGWTCEPVTAASVLACTWTGADLAVDGTLPLIEITAQVRSSWTTTIVNTATVTPTTDEPTVPGTTNNTDTVTTGSVTTVADLGIVKTVASDQLVAGGDGRYRLEVSNAGPSDALNVVVTDQLPAGVTYAGGLTSAPGDTWACTPGAAGVVDCTLDSALGTLPAGDSTWFEFDVEIASSVTGTLTNTATVSTTTPDPNPDNDTDTVTRDPEVLTNLVITKTHDSTRVYRVGDQIAFTLSVENQGPADAAAVMVTDTIPAALAFVETRDDAGWTVSGPDGSGVLTLALDAPLTAGDTATVTVVVEATQDAVPSATNAAEVTTTTTETTTTDNTTTDLVEVHTPDLEITKVASVEEVKGGDVFTYTLTVSNVDPDAHADAVTVTDVIPAELAVRGDVDAIGGTDWTCTLTGTDPAGLGGTLECALASLAAGATATPLVIEVLVAANADRDTIDNVATVASPDEHPSRVDERNTDHDEVTVRWIAFGGTATCLYDARSLNTTIETHNVPEGLPITLTWYQDADEDGVADGPAIATTVLPYLTQAMPLLASVLWPGTVVDEHGVAIAWPGLRQVLAGEHPDWLDKILDADLPEHGLLAHVLVTVAVDGAAPATLATVYPEDSPDCAVTRVPELTLDKTADVETVEEGGTVAYTLTVTNEGYGATNDVVLTDAVPADLRVTSVTPAAPSSPTQAPWTDCTVTGRAADGFGGTVTCALDGWLGHNGVAPDVTVTGTVRDGMGAGTVRNVATVTWTDPLHPETPSQVRRATETVNVTAHPLISLPRTGAEVAGTLALAGALVGLGAVVLAIRRRRA